MTERIRCRYCSWTAPATVNTRHGVVRCGYRRLREHIETAHPITEQDRLDHAEWQPEMEWAA